MIKRFIALIVLGGLCLSFVACSVEAPNGPSKQDTKIVNEGESYPPPPPPGGGSGG